MVKTTSELYEATFILVSKAASRGCVRLTNWDAQRVAMEVSKGTPVTFVDNSG